MLAPINKIIDFSVVDGPGNRTVVFFQGCNFNCKYCHNPETINLCNHCGLCVSQCPIGALEKRDDRVSWNPDKCVNCDNCIKACKRLSSPKIYWMTEEELADKVIRNIPFIRGVTCSGGECTIYKDFIIRFFGLIKGKQLSCLLDSNGGVIDFEHEPELLDLTDGVMLDIKSMDSEAHMALTGCSNDLVIKNAIYLASIGKLTEIRTVVTEKEPSQRNTIDNITKLLAPYLAIADIHYRIIAFRPFGVREQYKDLGTPSRASLLELEDIARKNGFRHITIT